jgi:DNA-binding NarL/FixJ family response regulator
MNPTPEGGNPITVAIVDGQQVLVEALKLVIGKEPDIQVVGEAGSMAGCLDLVERTHPAVLLQEVSLPDGDGLNLLPQINRISPHTKIVALDAKGE